MALYLKPRLPHNYVVRTSRVNRFWGKQEVSCPLPFTLKRGFKFSIEILITEPCYMISINGEHFCKYEHRLQYRDVRTLEVAGHIRDVVVERTIVDSYPVRSLDRKPVDIILGESLQGADISHMTDERDSLTGTERGSRSGRRVSWTSRTSSKISKFYDEVLPLPFYGSIDSSSFSIGRVFRVEGRVKLLPQSFYINLQNGYNIWPHPIIALHLSTCFTKQHTGAIGRTTLIRNAWIKGSWGVEERSDLVTQLRPGKAFSLCIVNNVNSFEIYVNHKLLANFKYRIHPSTIDTIYIQGDIKLWNVMLEQNLSFEHLLTEKHRKRLSIIRF